MVEKNKTEVHVSLTQSASNPNERTIEMLSFTNKLTHFCNYFLFLFLYYYVALFYAKGDKGR